MTIDIMELQTYINITILGCCLCLGYCIKCVQFIQNKYIPVILCVLGALMSCYLNRANLTLDAILCGMISGISSSAFYDAFRNTFIRKGDE